VKPSETNPQESESLQKNQIVDRYHDQKQAIAAFIKEFKNESDRACVILCAARVDYLLKQIIAKCLVPNVGSNDELLDNESALGTFNARIHAAYRLGLIDADFARALHIFRRLRNSFAHETAGSTFEHGPCKDRIHEMIAPLKAFRERYSDFRKAFFDDKPDIAADFYTVAVIMIVRLDILLVEAAGIRASYTLPFVPDQWWQKQGQ
jgi:hypothetical protein